jgi:membrane-associated protein
MENSVDAAPKVDRRYIKAGIVIIIFLFVAWGLSFVDDYTLVFLLGYLVFYKYLLIFVVAFLSGLMLPLPVNVLLLAVGSLTGLYFNFFIAMFTACVANTLGDTGSFLFFRQFGHKILREKYASRYKFFTNLEKFFQRNSGLCIFISRIIGVFSTPTDFISGYSKVKISKFMILSFFGNLAFAFIFLSIGHFVGDRWLGAAENVAYVSWGIVIIFTIYILKAVLRKEE